MNDVLHRFATEIGLQDDGPLRLAFALACVERIQHLHEDPGTQALVTALRDAVGHGAGPEVLAAQVAPAAELARSHRGSVSLDGGGHAAVSATHALARAIAGDALQAADYAAYAAVYAYGGHAVRDPSAYEAEFALQLDTLRRLHTQAHAARTASR